MDTQAINTKAAHSGRAFEKLISLTLDQYRNRQIAYLDFMPVPMAPIGLHPKHKRLVYIPKGKAPFDIYGYMGPGAGSSMAGTFVGAELKSTQSKKRLIVEWPTDKHSSRGLQYHQLESLYMVALSGGIARLVWENGGEVRVLKNEGIKDFYEVTVQGMNSRAAGNAIKSGIKSVAWDEFSSPEETGGLPDWLLA